MITYIKQDLQNLANPKQAALLQRFFKTGKGEYGESDIFFGIKVPDQRKIAKKYLHLELNDIQQLVESKYHEYRLTGFMMLEYKFQRANLEDQKKIYDFFIKNKVYANNWDIIDVTVPKVVGKYLFDKDRKILYDLAKSKSLWDKRIAVLATFWFIKQDDFSDSLNIAKILLHDKHDLIHKAVGWMLREIGKKNQAPEKNFLNQYHKDMPRTMLRYAIEKFDAAKKRYYMQK